MAGEKELILELFKDGKELSTSEVVNHIYQEILDNDNSLKTKSKLHRKLIYHLNNLVENRVLKVSRYLNRGEKVFSAARNIIVELPHSKLVILNKQHRLKGLEIENNYVFEFKPFGILVNSLAINAEKLDIIKLNSILKELYKEVNDVIAIYNAEDLLSKSSFEQLDQFFSTINSFINRRKLSIIIDFENPKSHYLNKLYNILKNNNYVEIVLLLKEENFISHNKQLESTIDNLRHSGQKINICKKRNKISFSGNAGAYTFFRNNDLLNVVCTNSLCVDFSKIKKLPAIKIKELLLKVAKGLHNVNSYQQLDNEELFPIITSYGGKITKGINAIRFWNYDWKEDEYLLELIEELKDELNKFALNQERIYVSAGMPINFKIVFSSAFNSFDREKLSERIYKKRTINSFNELSINYNEYLNLRNKYFSLIDYGDRLRIFRQETSSKELLKELHHLTLINIPYFSYDFRNLNKEISLRDFM